MGERRKQKGKRGREEKEMQTGESVGLEVTERKGKEKEEKGKL